MKELEYITGGIVQTRTIEDKTINNEFIWEVAGIALETIKSEIPDELRTYDLVLEIIKQIERRAKGSKMSL